MNVREAVGACFKRGAGVEPWGLQPAQGWCVGQLRAATDGPEQRGPVCFHSKGRISVQLSRSFTYLHVDRHVDLERSTFHNM